MGTDSMNREEKERRKRLRKGESVPLEGVRPEELQASCRAALEASWSLARTRPDEVAWVYHFRIVWDFPEGLGAPDIAWTGVRFSREPESEVLDEGRKIALTPIIGYKNGERVSPRLCTTVHVPEKVPDRNHLVSLDLENRWKKYAQKINRGG